MSGEKPVVRVSATQLRQDIYRILDRILETGNPVEIERKGRRLRISPVESGHRLSRLEARPYLKVDPEEIVEIDWSGEWRP
jgi:hypothetical protein